MVNMSLFMTRKVILETNKMVFCSKIERGVLKMNHQYIVPIKKTSMILLMRLIDWHRRASLMIWMLHHLPLLDLINSILQLLVLLLMVSIIIVILTLALLDILFISIQLPLLLLLNWVEMIGLLLWEGQERDLMVMWILILVGILLQQLALILIRNWALLHLIRLVVGLLMANSKHTILHLLVKIILITGLVKTQVPLRLEWELVWVLA